MLSLKVCDIHLLRVTSHRWSIIDRLIILLLRSADLLVMYASQTLSQPTSEGRTNATQTTSGTTLDKKFDLHPFKHQLNHSKCLLDDLLRQHYSRDSNGLIVLILSCLVFLNDSLCQ